MTMIDMQLLIQNEKCQSEGGHELPLNDLSRMNP
jgi:hypothetical protein